MAKRGRYILSVEDTARLHQVVNKTVRPWLWSALLLVFIGLFVALGWLIGYRQAGSGNALGARQRADLIDMMMRMDSLRLKAEISQAYIDNVSGILDSNRQPKEDSLSAVRPVAALPPDSLQGASETERRFISTWERENSYRVSALASMAAEGVRFGSLASAGITTQESLRSEEAEIIVPSGDPVLSPADARIIDLYFSGLKGGYTLLLQHPRGFLSRISGLGKVLVGEGATLTQGDPIGFGPPRNSSARGTVRVRIWHNGSPLIPADYLRLAPYNLVTDNNKTK